MARAPSMSPSQNQSVPPQGYRTDPNRTRSGFTPAQRVGGQTSVPPPRGSTFAPPSGEGDEEAEIELVEGRQSQAPQGGDWRTQPLTKSGHPDRRYRGQRDLPPPEANQGFTRARQGGMAGDIHVTIDGKPDRRFKENRNMSEEEATRVWLQQMNERYGIRTR